MKYEPCKWVRATTDSYGVLTVDRARYNVKEGWQGKRLAVKLDFNKVTIFDPDSFQCVGEHERDWSHMYERHIKKEYMSDWGKFMAGDPEAVEHFMQLHDITDRHASIRTFIEVVRDRQELPQMSRQKSIISVFKEIRVYGLAQVDQCCKSLIEQQAAGDMAALRAMLKKKTALVSSTTTSSRRKKSAAGKSRKPAARKTSGSTTTSPVYNPFSLIK